MIDPGFAAGPEEQQTCFRTDSHPYRLGHVVADPRAEGKVTGWRVLTDVEAITRATTRPSSTQRIVIGAAPALINFVNRLGQSVCVR